MTPNELIYIDFYIFIFIEILLFLKALIAMKSPERKKVVFSCPKKATKEAFLGLRKTLF